MDHEHLRAFVAFAERRNFTHAARALHLSQPALHVQIRKLTEAVGRPLYVRVGRTLELTAAGERLAAFGRDQLARSAAVLAELRGEPDRRPLVLAAGRGAFLHLLGPALRRFQRGGGALRLVVAGGDDAVAAVTSARADLAVTGAPALPRGLVVEPLRTTGHVAILPRAHRLAHRRTLRASDLAGEPLIAPAPGAPHRAALAAAFAAAGTALEVAVEAGDWDLMMHLAALGAGVAIVNELCRAPPGARAVRFDGLAPVTYQLVRRADAPAGAALARLSAILRADAG